MFGSMRAAPARGGARDGHLRRTSRASSPLRAAHARARIARAMRALNDATRAVAARHGVLCLEFAEHPARASATTYAPTASTPRAQAPPRAAAAFAALATQLGIQTDRRRCMTSCFARTSTRSRSASASSPAGARSPRPTSSRSPRLTGDMHPQHTDAAWAASSRFGERIAHGMLVLSYALGPDAVRPRARGRAAAASRDVVFKRPVLHRRHDPRRGRASSPARARRRARPRRRAAGGSVNQRERLVAPRERGGRLAARRRAVAAPRSLRARAGAAVILEGKRLLITGRDHPRTIAYAVAERAQQRGRRGGADQLRPRAADDRAGGEAAAAPPDVLELDVNERRGPRALRRPLASAGAASTARCTRSRSRPRTRSAATS